VIVPDVNLLLYVTIKAYPQHEETKEWWEGQINSGVQIGLADPVIYGFLRIGTNPRLYKAPMSVDWAAGRVEAWLEEANIFRAPAGSTRCAAYATSVPEGI
jgi:predicted nucleic acid-binding protein